jgi:putative membrane protein
MHRAQHLVLHHLGALLIALGRPAVVLGAALPTGFPRHAWPFRLIYQGVRILQRPFIASFVFVGLIAFWLIPSVHFAAMLSQPLYLLMNWSMLIDGVLFWLVLVDPRPPELSPMPGYGTRFLMIFGTMITQVLFGSYITFTRESLYSIYSVCGRALPISPARDQIIGGLLTWIPPAMMEAIVMLIVLSLMMNYEKHRPPVTPPAALAAAG